MGLAARRPAKLGREGRQSEVVGGMSNKKDSNGREGRNAIYKNLHRAALLRTYIRQAHTEGRGGSMG